MRLFLLLFLTISLSAQKVTPLKYQLFIFEGSDWCSSCIKLEKQILTDTKFNDFLLQNNIEIVRVDFPQRRKLTKEQKKLNHALAEKYSFNGEYPFIVLATNTDHNFKSLDYKNQTMLQFQTMLSLKIKELK